MSDPTDAPDGSPGHDPVQEVRAHLEQALASLDRLRGVLPRPSSSRRSDTGGGDPA